MPHRLWHTHRHTDMNELKVEAGAVGGHGAQETALDRRHGRCVIHLVPLQADVVGQVACAWQQQRKCRVRQPWAARRDHFETLIAHTHAHRHTDTHTHRHTDTQTHTDTQRHTQTHTHTHTEVFC